MNRLDELNLKLHSLVVFRGLMEDGALGLLPALLDGAGKDKARRLDDYARFAARVFEAGGSLSDCVLDRVLGDDNFYVRKRARGEAADPALEACVEGELAVLEEVAGLSARAVRALVGYEGRLPEWRTRPVDLAGEYRRMLERLFTAGYGLFARHSMFQVEGGELLPVRFPDPIRLDDLKGYERERGAVVNNTLALIDGRPAANALLYGDAGTGKSSTVKAIVNEYAPRGLRLVEVRKNRLMEIPKVLEALSGNPLRFILFVDDLSFQSGGEEAGALKAILEGSACARTPNVAIYATSNRRHIVSERFSDRSDDDIHRNETIQEQVSLSQRFGLSVCFMKPDRERYLEIVRALARGLPETEGLDAQAERYAIDRGGRSPRVARQFVDAVRRGERI
jgi:predicted AAA+ superfamily ATPase